MRNGTLLVGKLGFEPRLFLLPKQMPCQVRRFPVIFNLFVIIINLTNRTDLLTLIQNKY